MSVAGNVAAKGVWVYRAFLRPMRAGGGVTCRFTPSCSEYALEAFQTWGLFRGLWFTLRRLSRCHPWGGFGDDPVPERPDLAGSGTHPETEPLTAQHGQPEQSHQPRSTHVSL